MAFDSGSIADVEGIYTVLASASPGAVCVSFGHSNHRPAARSTTGNYGAPLQQGIYTQWPVGSWAGMQLPVQSANATLDGAYPWTGSFYTTSTSNGTDQIGDAGLNSEVAPTILPLYRQEFSGNVADNTDVATFQFDPYNDSFTWATEPDFKTAGDGSGVEFVLQYFSAAASNLGDGDVRARLRWNDGDASTTGYTNQNVAWSTNQGGTAGMVTETIDWPAPTTANQRPELIMQARLADETGLGIAYTGFVRKKSDAGLMYIACGRGNFGYNTSLGSAPAGGYEGNADAAAILDLATDLKTASHTIAYLFFHLGPADVVNGPITDETQFKVDAEALITRAVTQFETAGFTVTPIVCVDPRIAAVDADDHEQLNTLLREVKDSIGTSCGFISLYDLTGKLEYAEDEMDDTRHWSEAGAQRTADVLWSALELGNSGVTTMARASNAQSATDAFESTNLLAGRCVSLVVRCDTGSSNPLLVRVESDEELHSSTDQYLIPAGSSQEFRSSDRFNRIKGLYVQGSGGAADYSFTVNGV